MFADERFRLPLTLFALLFGRSVLSMLYAKHGACDGVYQSTVVIVSMSLPVET